MNYRPGINSNVTSPPSPHSHLTTVPQTPIATRVEASRPPSPLNPLIGRERERAFIGTLFGDPDIRLVTLTGPGGVGKTRLALSLAADLVDADRFPDGAVFVELATVRDHCQVARAIVQVLGVRRLNQEPAETTLRTALARKALLLVLDNFEQVGQAAPLVTDLLQSCPNVVALVTSRSRLNVSGEHVVSVPPLSLPQDSSGDLNASEAVRLFVQRTRAVNSEFFLKATNGAAVAEIVRRLDGLPLAIELAAARGALLPPTALLARLEKRLPHLTGGPLDRPARHQTMRDAIAWSYDLLSPTEQTTFRRLSVFVGGCTLESAARVCAESEDAIESLVRQNLIPVVAPSNGDPVSESPRVVMLETVREFALEQLAASGEEEAVRKAHADWCLALAEDADVAYRTLSGHGRSLALLQIEHANFRAALSWLNVVGETELSLRLAGMLSGFWYFRGHFSEGRNWLATALSQHLGGPPAVRARALRSAGMLAHYQGDDVQAMPLLDESLELWRIAGDSWGIGLTLLTLGAVAEDSGDYDLAERRFEEALALLERESYSLWTAHARYHLGVVAYGRSDFASATAFEERARDQFREAGDTWGIASSLGILGHVAVESGDLASAANFFAETLPVVREQRLPEGLLRALAGVATLATAADRPREAARLFGAVNYMAEELGLVFDLPQRDKYEEAIATLRERLGEPDFVTAWAAGRTLSREEALVEAQAIVSTPLTAPRAALSPRETEILHLLAQGLPDTAIAETLFLSVRTVHNHVAHIFAKLGVRTRSAAATAAREAEPTRGVRREA